MGNLNKLNKKAWNLLQEDERTALSLSLGYGKSTWEAGEIMNRAHFKYLEIQKRAAKFLEIFTNHFVKYKGLIADDLNLPFSFVEYLQLTILERNNISTAVKKMDSKKYLVTSARNKFIIKEMNSLRESPKESAQELYSLIMDFDRWNNFRILPMEIQEPSAYKRRNKARNIKHIKNITTLPNFSILKITEKFHYSGKYEKLYLPIVSNFLDEGYSVIPVKNSRKVINKITGIGLLLFPNSELAISFAILIYNYFLKNKKTCISGQRFWPEFRVLMDKAINKKELENIHKSRTYLDNAIFTQEEKNWVKKGEKMLHIE